MIPLRPTTRTWQQYINDERKLEQLSVREWLKARENQPAPTKKKPKQIDNGRLSL